MLTDDALLLIGHGSARYASAGCVVRGFTERIRAAGGFAEVGYGLLNGAPAAAEALAGLTASVVRVVPFFMEDGFFTRSAVPRALGACPQAGGRSGAPRRLVLCPPVGVHDGMADLLAQKLLDGCAACDIRPAAVAVLVVGHGSSRAPGRALALHRHAGRLAADGRFASVTTACLEEAPFVADALRHLRNRPVCVVGFFAGGGGHARDDVPRLVAAERDARGPAGPPVHDVGPVSDTPAMMQIIRDQAGFG